VIGEGFPATVAAARGGSSAAFSRLWRDANPALLRYLRVMAPGRGADIAAGTWVHAARGLGDFHGDEQAWRAYLFAICRGACDVQRGWDPQPPDRDDGLPAELPPAGAAGTAPDQLSPGSAVEVLAQLPPMEAEVILLRVAGGLGTEAVAELVGRSPRAVRATARRGLRRLAQILAETGPPAPRVRSAACR
jgi:RNA polymerase sigma-70 factor (ECF subfamily)